MSISSAIDVGQVIDDSKLNKVSIRVILLCGLIMIMDGYDFQLMAVASSTIMKEWNVNTESFGIVFSAVGFGYLFGAIICGTLSDLIGRKKTLILGASIFSIGTLLVYFSHSIVELTILRAFAGMGIGGAVPCAITLTSEYSPSKGRGKYVSVMYTGFLLGIVLAGFIAGFVLKSAGWRPLFLIGFFAPVVIIGVLIFTLPESARWLSAKYKTEKQRQTLVQAIGEMRPDLQIDADAQFTAALNKEKYSIKNLFAGRLVWLTPLIWAFYLISAIPIFFISSWVPHLLVEKGFSASGAAYITGFNGILVSIGCLLSGFYYDKFGFRRGIVPYVIASIFLFFMGGTGAIGFVLLLFASAFFINFAHMDVTILAPIVYPSKCRNQGAGTAIAIARIGAMLGPYIGGVLLATKLPRGNLMALVSIPLLISAVLCYIAGRQYDFYIASGKR
jgi:MFS transporter, AAHS family, 4-hydroxybenzoate transporter